MGYYHRYLFSPDTIEIPGGLKNGHQITVCGRVSGTNGFAINLQKTNVAGTDIAFHFNPRQSNSTVIRNTYQNGWQTEELTSPSFPFANGDYFKVHIHVTTSAYRVYVNSEFFIEYTHRINQEDMHYLQLTEGVEWHHLHIREKCRAPYSRPLPELTEGMCVVVKGLINQDAHGFFINFSNDESWDNIGFHFNPRMDEDCTVLNTKIDGSWTTEERYGSDFPFTRQANFDIAILVQGPYFKISVNGQDFANYNHRVPLENNRFLRVNGDIALMDVTVHDVLLDNWVRPIHGGLRVDDLISIEGFFKPNNDSFHVDLLAGMSTNSDRALCVKPQRAQDIVVLHNTISGERETEVTYPYRFGQMSRFWLHIINKENYFDIHFNGDYLGSFPHQVNVENIKSIFCPDRAYIHSIEIHHKLPNPRSLEVPGNHVSGDWCSVLGITDSNSSRFALNIKSGPSTEENATDDILFHYNPRFTQMETVRNTLHNGVWGIEEKEEPEFPFEKMHLFEINMLLTNDDFKVVANLEHHIDYRHRISPSHISHLITQLDADYYITEFY